MAEGSTPIHPPTEMLSAVEREGGRRTSGRTSHLERLGSESVPFSVPGNVAWFQTHILWVSAPASFLTMALQLLGLIIALCGAGQSKTGVAGCSEQPGIFPTFPLPVPGHPASPARPAAAGALRYRQRLSQFCVP